jgi:hypothetical protein
MKHHPSMKQDKHPAHSMPPPKHDGDGLGLQPQAAPNTQMPSMAEMAAVAAQMQGQGQPQQ